MDHHFAELAKEGKKLFIFIKISDIRSTVRLYFGLVYWGLTLYSNGYNAHQNITSVDHGEVQV